MSLFWTIIIYIALGFFLLNGTIGYYFRSRQIKQQGLKPPNYLIYLFYPRPIVLSEKVWMPIPLRLMLGIIILAGGAFFILSGILVLSDFEFGKHNFLGLLSLLLIFMSLGTIFGYVGIRLVRSDSLLQRKRGKGH